MVAGMEAGASPSKVPASVVNSCTLSCLINGSFHLKKSIEAAE
jgi:hypothetical protein